MVKGHKIKFLIETARAEGRLDWDFVKSIYARKQEAKAAWATLVIEKVIDKDGNYLGEERENKKETMK